MYLKTTTLFLLVLSGCGTIRPVVLPPTEISREMPVEAMKRCQPLPSLPETVPSLKIGPALAELIKNKVTSDAIYRECAENHKALRKWILDD